MPDDRNRLRAIYGVRNPKDQLLIGIGICSRALRFCIVCVVLSQCPGCIPPDPPGLPVVGAVVDADSGEPLSGVAVLVRTLADNLFETGRGSALAVNGGFQVRTFPIAGAPAPDPLEVTITRDSCETQFVFEKDNGFTVENMGLFAGELTFRITDPIRVPRCAEDGDVPP